MPPSIDFIVGFIIPLREERVQRGMFQKIEIIFDGTVAM